MGSPRSPAVRQMPSASTGHLVTNKKPMSPLQLEGHFRALTVRFTQRCTEAQQALQDLADIQTEIEGLHGANSSDGLPAGMLGHIERISELNLDDFIGALLEAEQEEAEFLEDGSSPPPPAGFVNDEDDK